MFPSEVLTRTILLDAADGFREAKPAMTMMWGRWEIDPAFRFGVSRAAKGVMATIWYTLGRQLHHEDLLGPVYGPEALESAAQIAESLAYDGLEP